jgi:hypothetical protein
MVRISFPRHFVFLAIASVLLIALRQAPSPLNSEHNYVLYGVLHALAVVSALRRPVSVLEIGTFIVGGGVLSLGAFWVGLYLGAWFGESTSVVSWVLNPLVLGSAVGASTYGLVVRLLWLPQLPYASIALMTAGCAIATMAVLLLSQDRQHLDAILTLAWWWTFSSLLWTQTLRPWHLTMRSSGP